MQRRSPETRKPARPGWSARRWTLVVLVILGVFGAFAWWSLDFLSRHDRLPWEKVDAEPVSAPAQPPPQGAGGLVVGVFAEPPQVGNPAALHFDERGRLWIAESSRWTLMWNLGIRAREYWLLDDLACVASGDRLRMYEKWRHRIPQGMDFFTERDELVRWVEDADGDGKADRSLIFADGFNDVLTGTANGILPLDGQVLFACAPRLWSLKDSDGDGKADERQPLLEGFGTAFSWAHDLHGLIRGPDGRIYFSLGDRGYEVRTPDGRVLARPHTGAVFRCNPDGSGLEAIAHGFRNPYELAFDDFGNLFTVDNNAGASDQCRVLYVIEGGEYGWHMSFETWGQEDGQSPWIAENLWTMSDQPQPAWLTPAIGHLGGGPAGLAHYPGTGLDANYRGHFFLCDFLGSPAASGIRAFSVTGRGAGFQLASARDFARNLVPTDLAFGQDGRVYVADWVKGWNSEGQGRILTLHDPASVNSPEARQAQQLLREGLAQKPLEELGKLLAHADQRVRQQAQFALVARGSAATAALQSLARSQSGLLARLHAIWGLGMLARNDPLPVTGLAALLDDPQTEVRAQAAKVLGEAGEATAGAALTARLADAEPRVRFFAAQALGKLRHRQALAPLLAMLRANAGQDPFLRHAGVVALAALDDPDPLLAHAKDESPAVRVAIVLALRRLGDARVADFLNDADARVLAEAVSAIHDQPIAAAFPALEPLIERRDLGEWVFRRVLNAHFRAGSPANARALMQVAADHARTEAIRAEALNALADWAEPSPRDRVLGSFRPLPPRDPRELTEMAGPWLARLLAETDGRLRNAAVRLASRLRLRGRDADFAAWVGDAAKPVRTRLEALRLLAERGDEGLGPALDTALMSGVPALRVMAATILSTNQPARALPVWGGLLADGSWEERQQALAALARLPQPEAEAMLREWVGRLSGGDLPPELKLDVIEAARQRPALRALVQPFETAFHSRAGLPRAATLLAGGSPERGRAVFERAELQCRHCHRINGVGGVMGPDLSRTGADRSAAQLLEAVLWPNQTIAEGYASVTLLLKDGATLTGVLREETNSQLVLVDPGGNLRRVDKARIERRVSGLSAMPENLAAQLTPLELRDLVAFLASLKGG